MTASTVTRQLGSDEELGRLARLFHALSDETRLKIVARLLSGEQCVCNLTDALDAGQSRLSFHVKTLKEAGLIRGDVDGPRVCYCIEPRALRRLKALMGGL